MISNSHRRFRFLPSNPPPERPYREWQLPVPAALVADRVPGDHVAASDELLVVESWPVGKSARVVKTRQARVRYAGGMAEIKAPIDKRVAIESELLDFRLIEIEIEKMEAELNLGEAEIDTDVPLTMDPARIAPPQRASLHARWERTVLTRLRLTRLRAEIDDAPGRRWRARLLRAISAEDRIDRLFERLEYREELCEDALDRLADLRGWRYGHRLEIAIIVLLFIEILFMAGEMILRLREE